MLKAALEDLEAAMEELRDAQREFGDDVGGPVSNAAEVVDELLRTVRRLAPKPVTADSGGSGIHGYLARKIT